MNYVAYHLHTENSLLDSCTNYKLYVDKAVELGQKAICFTEHGNIFNWVEKKMYCDKMGIKYLHGIECYLTASSNTENKVRDNYHTILIAKNEDGFKELNKLVFLSTQKDHFYYNPRLTFDEFLNISDNIIKISACVQSPLNKYKGERLEELFKHYDYYEIQYHNFEEQIEYNKFLYKMSKKYNKPLIVGTDTHSLDAYKGECRMILMLSKGMTYSYEEDCDLTYQSYDSLIDKFKEQNSLPMDIILDAINNTNIMADSVYDMVLDTKIKYPYLYPNDEEVLWDVLRTKFKDKYNKNILDKSQKQVYIDNIKEEMRVFKKTDMIGFMLFMSELVSDNKAKGVKFGYSRGSCFTKDALVLTDSGYKTINNVIIGDKVISDDNRWHTVENTLKYNVYEPMVEIRHYKQGSCYKKYKTQCTLDHRFLVNRNGIIDYISAKDLKIGDLLCSPKIKNDIPYKEKIIDLNDYNIFGFKYDDKYIYEKIFIANKGYRYSSRWFKANGYDINASFCWRIIRGWRPVVINSITQRNIDNLLSVTGFNTLDDYAKYCSDKCWKVRPIKRYIKKDMLFNIMVGMMYGDGWTQKDYAIGLAVNSKSKQTNRKLFYKFANSLGISNDEIYVNVAKTKDLQQLFINSRILNNYWKINFFSSKKGHDKVFNSELLNQPVINLKGLLYGLKITDGSVNNNANKSNYDSTSLSLVGAYSILDNIINHVMPNAIDVRLPHIDKRNPDWENSESYKLRRGIVKTSRQKYTEDDMYWYLPVEDIRYIEKHNNTVLLYIIVQEVQLPIFQILLT